MTMTAAASRIRRTREPRAWLAIAGIAAWIGFLVFSAQQSLAFFLAGLGTAPAYGDTGEYWKSAVDVRVDSVRTWLYPFLIKAAPGWLESTTSIRWVQVGQLTASLLASGLLGWVLAGGMGRWLRMVAASSTAVLSGASFLAVHFSHAILMDSLATSGWMTLLVCLVLLLQRRRIRTVAWMTLALPSAVLVAGLRWERTYLALILVAVAAFAIWRTFSRLDKKEATFRLSLCLILALAVFVSYAVFRYTRKVDGRASPGVSDLTTNLAQSPGATIKTFIEYLVSPLSPVIGTTTGATGSNNYFIDWTNTRILGHVGHWPTFLWLSSALLFTAIAVLGLFLRMPAPARLGGFGAGSLALVAIFLPSVMMAVAWPLFHPRYGLPITSIELTWAALVPVAIAHTLLQSSSADVPEVLEPPE